MFGFGKKKFSGTPSGKSETAKRLIELLNCPCEYFPSGTNGGVVLSAYNEAFARREMDGCTPMIIVADDLILENIEDCEQSPEELLNSPQIDTQKWFTERLSEWKENMGAAWNNVVGTIACEQGDISKGFSGFLDFSSPRKSKECILAKIPVTNPWEVFARLPFGGWNECPLPEEILWIAKYWYEKYGAIPAVITHDILEFAARPVKDKTAAMDLALEQFAFCSDIVFQGVETIGRLAGGLIQSSTWYFWWD